jgi:glycosyltransferase involved in cell wall biosynthesis
MKGEIMATVSLIIPVYNEASHLEEFLKIVDDLQVPTSKELVIIDDCSTDGSAAIVERFIFKSNHVFLKEPCNRGKSAALRSGIEKASGDFIIIQDADFEYDATDIPKLLQPLIEGKADVIYGSRFRRDSNQVHRTFHYLVNRILTILSNLLSGLYFSDMETCYKLFRSDIIKNIVLESNRFGFEPEVTAKIARLKVRVLELPVRYFPRAYIEGKKITWKDGIAALWHIFYYNVLRTGKGSYRDTLPQKYIPDGRQWF